jgi:hypothetical protein
VTFVLLEKKNKNQIKKKKKKKKKKLFYFRFEFRLTTLQCFAQFLDLERQFFDLCIVCLGVSAIILDRELNKNYVGHCLLF